MFSQVEMEYLLDLVSNHEEDDKVKSSMIPKIKRLLSRAKTPNKLLNYISNEMYESAADFDFEYELDPCLGSAISITSPTNFKYLICTEFLESNIEDRIIDELHDEDKQLFKDNIRICSECGKPIDRGYVINGNIYLHSKTEFVLYMNKMFGKDGWNIIEKNDEDSCKLSYVIKDENGCWVECKDIYWAVWYTL